MLINNFCPYRNKLKQFTVFSTKKQAYCKNLLHLYFWGVVN